MKEKTREPRELLLKRKLVLVNGISPRSRVRVEFDTDMDRKADKSIHIWNKGWGLEYALKDHPCTKQELFFQTEKAPT